MNAFRLRILWDLMTDIDAGKIAWALAGVAGWLEQARLIQPSDFAEAPYIFLQPPEDHDGLERSAGCLAEELGKAGAPISARLAELLLRLVLEEEEVEMPKQMRAREFVPWSERRHTRAKEIAQDLWRTTPRELSSIIFYCVPPEQSSLIKNTQPFGEKVARQFPSIGDNPEEAAKCLAFGRGTASVFHSTRCLEAGIHALRLHLGFDPPAPNKRSWSRLLRDVRSALHVRWPDEDERTSGAGRHIYAAYRALTANNPYRNETMHLKASYTEEQAREAFEIIGMFLRGLAEQMDEKGEPRL